MANNVYKFPGVEPARETSKQYTEPTSQPKSNRPHLLKRVMQGGWKALWFTLVLFWPVLRWVVALDVVYQAGVMAWHWNDPGTFAGWTFLLHFVVLVALTYFVSVYKPQGVK
ncbi:KleE stable inheritance protein (plasmid) [Pseudomonas sp. WOUb67]|uniref:KleE stable inheritance protein n=1 Tax=Pseudomonas sp. WOUb67 TaxID=3161136 RepID=UPI003CED4886